MRLPCLTSFTTPTNPIVCLVADKLTNRVRTREIASNELLVHDQVGIGGPITSENVRPSIIRIPIARKYCRATMRPIIGSDPGATGSRVNALEEEG